MIKKIRLPALCIMLAAALLGITGCQGKAEKNSLREAIPVKVERIKYQDLEEIIDYIGNVRAQDEANVYPKVSGKVIEKVKDNGDSVKKGEVICYVDRDEVGFKYERAPVESPLSGTVGRVYVDIGTSVSTDKAVALVVDMDRVKIDLDIPEKYLPSVSIGQEAQISVDAYPGEVFKGVVDKISPVVDISTRSSPIEIIVENPKHLLKSGMFAKARLAIQKRENVAVLLKEAIIGKNSNRYVYVAENNKAALRKITVGIRQGPYYEVKEGLKEGDAVVIMGQQKLYEGADLRIEE